LITPDGDVSKGAPGERLVPKDAAERIAVARRVVADRCLYGVDINPMAVEMAKLSLWLITLQRDRPFTFLDHALKCGDSLLGISSIKQIETFSLRPEGKQGTFATANLTRTVEESSAKRRALKTLPSRLSEQLFPTPLSALSIPRAADKLGRLVEEQWAELKDTDDIDELRLLRKRLQKFQSLIPLFTEFKDEEIWEAIETKRKGQLRGEGGA
jgi:hypothetical protein